MPEKYGENFDVSSEGPSSGSVVALRPYLETLYFSLYFSSSCIPTNESFVLILHTGC